MCRMFALRSHVTCPIERALIDADCSLERLSHTNPHGWGVAHYVQGVPQLVKSPEMAADTPVYDTLSSQIESKTVVAHVRRATHGDHTIGNTHPFQYGRWVFAHNGNIAGFDEVRSTLREGVASDLRPHILGDTDSEILFYVLLTALSDAGHLDDDGRFSGSPKDLWEIIRPVVTRVAELGGGMHTDPDGPSDRTYLTFVLTDGQTLIGHQGGKPLFVHAPSIDHENLNEPPWVIERGTADHFLLASEPAHDPQMWTPIQQGGVVGVGHDMSVWTSPEALEP